MLSAKLKMNAPNAHTWLEIVYARWGKAAHLTFMFFGELPWNSCANLGLDISTPIGLSTNIIVSAMLCLGGSATVTDLTGAFAYVLERK